MIRNGQRGQRVVMLRTPDDAPEAGELGTIRDVLRAGRAVLYEIEPDCPHGVALLFTPTYLARVP